MWKSLIFRHLRNGNFALTKIPHSERFLFSAASLRCDRGNGRNNGTNELSNLPQIRVTNTVLDPVSQELIDTVKSFLTTDEVLQFLKTNPRIHTIHYLPIFSTIYKFQKIGHSNMSNEQIIKDPDFEKLCKDVKKNVRYLNGTELIAILKALLFLNVSANSSLCQNLLQMISKSVNKLTIAQTVFLTFLVKQCSSSPLVDALKIATPVVFEAIIRPQLDKENPDRVFQAFMFAFSESCISESTREFLVDVALKICDKFSTSQAHRMSVALCKVDQTSPSPEQVTLYKYLMDHVADFMSNQLKISEVNLLVGACIKAYTRKSELYFHEKFLENSMQCAVDYQASILEIGNLLRNYSRVSYPCYKLIDYLDEKLAKHPDFEKVGSLEPFIGFLSSCSNCSYKPKFWLSYQERFVELIDKNKTGPIPLIRVVTDLVVMKCWVSSLIDYCFREEFLDSFLRREQNKIDYLALLRLYQAVSTIYPGGYKHNLPSHNVIEEAKKIELDRADFPLEGALSYAVGGYKYVLSGVSTRYGHFIDHVIVRQKSGKLTVINENELKGNCRKTLESLEFPPESQMMGVLLLTPASYCLDGMKIRGNVRLKIHSLEALGVAVIPVSRYGFMRLLDHEKIPYLANKINSRTFAPNLSFQDETLIQLDQ